MKTPRELADRHRKRSDGFSCQTFVLPREAPREQARKFLEAYPAAAYMSTVDAWQELPDDAAIADAGLIVGSKSLTTPKRGT